MTATTGAPWNLVYQEFSDLADISAAVQDLADSVDTAVQSLYDAQTIGQAPPACRIEDTAAQSIPNKRTPRSRGRGSEDFDTDTMINNAATINRITLTSTGIYLISLRCTFQSTASGGGVRQTSMTHSTLGVFARNTQLGTTSSTAAPFITAVVPCCGRSVVTFQAFQTSAPPRTSRPGRHRHSARPRGSHHGFHSDASILSGPGRPGGHAARTQDLAGPSI
jgi:hypothetical protein